MLLPHQTLIAVADGGRLVLFYNAGNEAAPRIEGMRAPQLPTLGHGSGGRHHSSAANPDARTLDEDSHASAVAAWLNQEALGGRVTHLVVIASPKTLGELRPHYHAELRKRLIGEIAREMTEATGPEVAAAVAALH